MDKLSGNFMDIIHEDLKDPSYAADFLNNTLEEYLEDGDIESFNTILAEVVKAGNVSQIAKDADISRAQLYRMISGKSEANLPKLLKLLNTIGLKVTIQAKCQDV